MLLHGRLYRGADGLAGELGHVLVDAGGRVCRCGNRGCLETVAGADALAESLRLSHGEGLDGRAIAGLALEGDLGCRRVIADAGRAIGRTAAALVNVLNPELLIVGGDLAQAGDLLLDGVRESLGLAALPSAAEGARVVAGSLGDRAEVLGAIALVLSEADRDHLLRPLAGAAAR
jgi:predicted NBD/HSP70 family sugar kinase